MTNTAQYKNDLLIISFLLFVLSFNSQVMAQDLLKTREMHTVYPKDHGGALINPDMGWTMHFYSNVLANYGSKLEAWDTLDDFPGVSTVYLRVPWVAVQPEEDRYTWEILDTPAQRWTDKGKKVAIRITATENWMTQATPPICLRCRSKKKYRAYDYFEPDYSDPVFSRR